MFTRRSRRPAPLLLASFLLLLPACSSQRVEEPPPPPTGPGPLTSPSPATPPEPGPQTQPVPGSAPPARTPRVESVEDIPPPPAAQGSGPRVSADPPPAAAPARGLREVFPHVRIDPEAKVLEIDATVLAPTMHLELVVCTPRTKEHEALVVSPARPSNVHAALLLLNLEPGKPGTYVWEGQTVKPVDPTGPPLDIAFVLDAGTPDERTIDPRAWILDERTKRPFGSADVPFRGSNRWVFAGSRIVRRDLGPEAGGVREVYVADGDDGSLIGLATFGSETIAWNTAFSPDSALNEPLWIHNTEAMPPEGTPLIVRITPALPTPQPAAPDTAPTGIPAR